jgi:hypothetical protein
MTPDALRLQHMPAADCARYDNLRGPSGGAFGNPRAMAELKLYGMKTAFDEIIAIAVKRPHEPERIVGDLLIAEIIEK